MHVNVRGEGSQVTRTAEQVSREVCSSECVLFCVNWVIYYDKLTGGQSSDLEEAVSVKSSGKRREKNRRRQLGVWRGDGCRYVPVGENWAFAVLGQSQRLAKLVELRTAYAWSQGKSGYSLIFTWKEGRRRRRRRGGEEGPTDKLITKAK